MTQENLKPCPFCGSADLKFLEWDQEDSSRAIVTHQAVECHGCYSTFKDMNPESWNTRAEPRPAEEHNCIGACCPICVGKLRNAMGIAHEQPTDGAQGAVSERHRECAERLLTITGHILTSQSGSFTRRFCEVLKDEYENQTPYAWAYDGLEDGSPRIGFVFTSNDVEEYWKKGFSVFPLFTTVPSQTAEIERLRAEVEELRRGHSIMFKEATRAQESALVLCDERDQLRERVKALEEALTTYLNAGHKETRRLASIQAKIALGLIQPAKGAV